MPNYIRESDLTPVKLPATATLLIYLHFAMHISMLLAKLLQKLQAAPGAVGGCQHRLQRHLTQLTFFIAASSLSKS